jgi:hypothetical protein
MRASTSVSYLWALVLTGYAGVILAAEPCTGFKWDVTREQMLFAGRGTALTAGKVASAAPGIGTDKLYELELAPQADVSFAAVPGKKQPSSNGAFAGLVALRLPAPGNYRVSVDLGLWLDVVANGKLAATRDFQGQHDCAGPHKIVEFDLSGAREFLLQMSSSPQSSVRLAVTAAPADAR